MHPKTGFFFSFEKYWIWILLLILAGFFLYLALKSAGVYGGADTYLHYSISHYAFKHPYLFVDHWGKPLFTALSSPFAQIGFFGLQVFNIILSIFSAYFSYLVCKQLKLQFSWLSIILILFAPVYFILVFTGLTETLFGFVLILSIYLFFKEKYIAAALLISFLPFARTEGFVIIPLFAMALGYKKKWNFIVLLATGFVFYSIIGNFHYHDFFWIFNKNPYKGAKDIYGKGSLWHFVVSYREIFGNGFTLLIMFGILAFIQPIISKHNRKPLPVISVLLILMPTVLYFAAHSFLWWRGMNGSLGLLRVMAGIIPTAGILGIIGINYLFELAKKYYAQLIVFGVLLFGYIIYEPFSIYTIPFKNGGEEKLLGEVAYWVKNNKLDQHKMYSGNTYFFFKLDQDVFDESKVSIYFPPKEELSNWTKPGDLAIWDSHFGPNECNMKLESLLNNKYWLLNAIFLPDQNFMTMGGIPYEIYVFQRVSDTLHPENKLIQQNILTNYYTTKPYYLNTFSKGSLIGDQKCFIFTPGIEFSPCMDTMLGKFDLYHNKKFEMSADIFLPENSQNSAIELVSSVTYHSRTYMYYRFPVNFSNLQPNKWNHVAFKFVLPDVSNKKARFKVYVWNNSKIIAFIDNLCVKTFIRNPFQTFGIK